LFFKSVPATASLIEPAPAAAAISEIFIISFPLTICC
jgi:hypothetical protein